MSQASTLLRQALRVPLTLCAVAVAFAPSRIARAQDVFDAKTAAHVLNAYVADLDALHARIMALANAIPDEKYSWRPTPQVRSVSEVFMHVAGEWYFYTPRSVAGNPPADFGAPQAKLDSLEKKFTTKADVFDQLNKSWTHGRKEVASADPATLTGAYKPFGDPIDRTALIMTGDLHEHLGQLIVYARLVGVKPPWSK